MPTMQIESAKNPHGQPGKKQKSVLSTTVRVAKYKSNNRITLVQTVEGLPSPRRSHTNRSVELHHILARTKLRAALMVPPPKPSATHPEPGSDSAPQRAMDQDCRDDVGKVL